jgi:thiosulfate/3-mercaptopyruvate sulfurtransferase
MKKKIVLGIIAAVAVFLTPVLLMAREISPIVSTDWLEKNLNNPKLVTVDIRKVEQYKEGHIPNSVNVFYGVWAVKKKDLSNELPEEDDLYDAIGSVGIRKDSMVVLVGPVDPAPDRLNATRVAWTLVYAGVDNVAILDGGYDKWAKEKKAISTETVKPKAAEYKGKAGKGIFATKEELVSKVGKATLLDTRTPEFFFGVSKLDFVEKAGHIQGAVSLPAPWMFTQEGTFKETKDLEAMAYGVVGAKDSKEIITYCDSGRFATGWWFTLKEVLGYKNVKSYDGSMQELTKDPSAPIVKYRWQ